VRAGEGSEGGRRTEGAQHHGGERVDETTHLNRGLEAFQWVGVPLEEVHHAAGRSHGVLPRTLHR
jgi:hypothetical protein